MNLIEAREKLNLTQKEAANKIGISQSMLAMMETGSRSGTDRTKIKIANFYHQSIESLFFDFSITKRDRNNTEHKEAMK